MKYEVYQINLTRDDIKESRETVGTKHHAHMTTTFCDEGAAQKAWDAGFYNHVCNIIADDLDDVFRIGNIGPEEDIERLDRMHSISVGDIIKNEDGEMFVVTPDEFDKI